MPIVYLAADLLSLWLAVSAAYYIRFKAGFIPLLELQEASLYTNSLLIASPFYSFVLWSLGNYQKRHGRLSPYETGNLFRSLAVFYMTSIALTYLLHYNRHSRLTLLIGFLLNIALCLLFRKLLNVYQIRQWRAGHERERILVLGADTELTRNVVAHLKDRPDTGFTLSEVIVWSDAQPPDIPYDRGDRILVVGSEIPFGAIADYILNAPSGMTVNFIPRYHLFLRNLPFREYMGTYPLLPLNQHILPDWNSFSKRMMDVTLSVLLLLVLSPLMLAGAVCILAGSGRPILFRQKRVGLNGRLFTIYKFRTMKDGAEQEASPIIASQKQAIFKVKDDPRVQNAFARMLRRTGFDELPQLWNVLTGEMSLVGPRPATPELMRNYTPEHKLRLVVPPGITGLQQVMCRGTDSIDEVMKYDLKYLSEQSLWLDVKILLKTISTLVTGRGVS